MKRPPKRAKAPNIGIDGFSHLTLLTLTLRDRSVLAGNKYEEASVSLDKALKNLKYDVRMIEFNINQGQVSKDELKAHLNSLPDLASNAQQIDLEEGAEKSSSQQH